MPIYYFTQDGFTKLESELYTLKTEGRKKVADQLSEARSKGDLSENAEYDAAKDAQALLELKISKIEDKVNNARVLTKNMIDTSKVSILTKVRIKNLKNNMELSYGIVSEDEANLKEGKISVGSAIAKGLLGKKINEKAKITTPAGELEFLVMDIKSIL